MTSPAPAGAELARACAAALWERDPATRALGIRLEEAREEYARLSMRVEDSMLNGHEICHGGFIFFLADSAFAYACNSRNQVNLGQKCQIQYLRPGRRGDRLTAVAEQVSRDGRDGHYQVAVTDQNGNVIARFQGQSRQVRGAVLPEKAASP